MGLYLINSRRDIFIPILKITLGCIGISKTNTFKKDILKGDASLAVYYFNHAIFRWEPILEKINLAFHKLTYFQESNSIFGCFEAIDPFMLNLSREVFSSLQETMEAWRKQSDEEANRLSLREGEPEPLEFISHYIIRN